MVPSAGHVAVVQVILPASSLGIIPKSAHLKSEQSPVLEELITYIIKPAVHPAKIIMRAQPPGPIELLGGGGGGLPASVKALVALIAFVAFLTFPAPPSIIAFIKCLAFIGILYI